MLDHNFKGRLGEIVVVEQIVIAEGEGAKAALGAVDYLICTPAEVQ